MELLVCVKQVPDDSVSVKLGADGQPDLKDITPVVNAFDTYALEMATRFKEANGCTVSVVTVGDLETVTPSLRSCLSVGADSAYDVNETEGCVNGLIAAAAQKAGSFDVIFVGSESTDKAGMEVGARVSNKLGLPLVTNILALEPADGGLKIKQETEDGYRTILCPTPCVVTVVKPDYEPRYPSIKSKLAARKMPIGEFKAADLGVEACGTHKVETVKISAPAKRQAGIKIIEKEKEVAVARAMDMLAERKLV